MIFYYRIWYYPNEVIYYGYDITTADISANDKQGIARVIPGINSRGSTKEEIKMTKDTNRSLRVLGSVRLASALVLAAAYLLMLFSSTGMIELSDTVVRIMGALTLVAAPVLIFASVRIIVLKGRNRN